LLLDVPRERILIEEPITFPERVFRSLQREHHVTVRDVDIHPGVSRPCYKGSLVQGILRTTVSHQTEIQ